LNHVLDLSERQIESAVGVGHGTVGAYIRRAAQAGLTWEQAEKLSDAEVEALLFQQVGRNEPAARAAIDLPWVHMELRRAGVTLELLWSEYQQAVADGGSGQRPYQYSQFCELYRAYKKKLSPVMRQTHRAGEKSFLDFSGKKPRIINAATGEEIEVELFVMVLGASSYTYAEATRTQSLADFVGATVHGLEYFCGVTEILVPDQLRSAVKTPDRYEPEINATYSEMALHYGTAIVPARPRKPRDKAKVEGGVLIAQRWILACLRNRRFFSLEELNAAIRELLEKLNTRPFKKLEGCRRSAFEKLDRPAMRPLPARRYEIGAWKLGVGVNLDHHLDYDHRFYSVPCELIKAKVDVRASATVIEVWRDNRRITSHERSYGPKGTAVTKPEHRPRAHREWGEWPPERLVAWAQTRGPKTGEVAAAILARGPHAESGRRACLGLVRLGERHGSERLEAACGRALAIGNPTYKSVNAILKNGLEKAGLVEEVEPERVVHENIRGGEYFDREEVKQASTHGEIESRYLDEERLSIINEPSFRSDRQVPESSRTDEGLDASNQVTVSAPRFVATEPLPALLGRLQAMWTKPRPTVRIGRQAMGYGGGDDSQSVEDDGSSCANRSDCAIDNEAARVAEESRKRSVVLCKTTCDSDDGLVNGAGPRRGEMG
jgi:transposase